MATASKVVSIAAGQIGYKESRGNRTKYGKAYGMDGVAWCMIFVWWCMTQAGQPWYKTASCTACYNHYKSQAVGKYSLKKGDIVFFDFDRSGDCDHVGIVESAGADRVVTIEGNTSSGNSGSQSNGDGVYRRYRSYSQIARAIRPSYEAESGGNITVTVAEVKKGSKGQAVKNLQLILNNRGYNCGTADGDFGAKTYNAVIAFQKAKGLSRDGIVGAKTWTALFK